MVRFQYVESETSFLHWHYIMIGYFNGKNGDADDFGVISRKVYSVVTPMAMTAGVYHFQDANNMEFFRDK